MADIEYDEEATKRTDDSLRAQYRQDIGYFKIGEKVKLLDLPSSYVPHHRKFIGGIGIVRDVSRGTPLSPAPRVVVEMSTPFDKFHFNVSIWDLAKVDKDNNSAFGVVPVVCTAVLNVRGEHFTCTQMEHMAEGSQDHDGWAHSNSAAQAIWTGQ